MEDKGARNKIKNQISNFTKGLISNFVDLILFEAKLFEEFLMDPQALRSMKLMLKKFNKTTGLTSSSEKNAIYNAKKLGWIEKDGGLTKEGRRKLSQIIPSWQKVKKWDGKWYLVIFDIPEKIKSKRDILREKLKKLGFGQLQASVWVSPFNYLNNVLEIVKFYKLEPYVILSETDKLGQEESRVLAKRVWKLDRTNEEYKQFIQKYSSLKSYSKFELEIDFYSILGKDPQLPLDLLPVDWKGEEPFALYEKLSKDL
jgi:phenylacetic acid degradation operon negative regulatory protein